MTAANKTTTKAITNATTTATPSRPATVDMSLVPARELAQFNIKAGWIDPRGWDVMAENGESIGVVSRLMLEPVVHDIRYLEVALRGTPAESRTLVPVGLVTPDLSARTLKASVPNAAVLINGPKLTGDVITADAEQVVLRAIAPEVTLTTGSKRYGHSIFDPKSLAAKPVS